MSSRTAAYTFAILVTVGGAGSALAQAPGANDVAPPPTTIPALNLTVPPLTRDEIDLLGEGEIGDGRMVAGGLIGTLYGYGLGHVVQGRWLEQGWIFTAGEVGSMALLLAGAVNCSAAQLEAEVQQRRTSCSSAPIVAGIAGVVGFRIWEIVDVWRGPRAHNVAVYRARQRLHDVQFFAAPTGPSSAATGLSLRF